MKHHAQEEIQKFCESLWADDSPKISVLITAECVLI